MTFSEGDIVKHKAEFLRSVGWYTDVPVNGQVVKAEELRSGQILTVDWSDGITSKILANNVVLAGKVELA